MRREAPMRRPVLTRSPWFLLPCFLVACVNVTGDGGDPLGPAHDGGADLAGKAPTVKSVTITPDVPHVDGDVQCTARVEDADSAKLTTTLTWRNATRDTSLGKGERLTLHPGQISPGEKLTCEASVEDPEGHTATGRGSVEPGCGFADDGSLADATVSIHITFRPFITDELIPGYEGEPWDWDGSIPGWIEDLVDVLAKLADGLAWVYPDPSVMSAAEALDWAQKIIDALNEYGPGLFAATVPPDPNLYPYLVDAEGALYSIGGVGDGFDWDDSYEVDLRIGGVDLRDLALAVDMEDYDVSFDDNMGDYLDQGSTPLLLGPELLADSAYCTATYYNPTSKSRDSEYALIPSSILWMEIEVE